MQTSHESRGDYCGMDENGFFLLYQKINKDTIGHRPAANGMCPPMNSLGFLHSHSENEAKLLKEAMGECLSHSNLKPWQVPYVPVCFVSFLHFE